MDRLRGIENGEGIRALIRVRCDNMEENNKYRLGREARKCMFCERRRDEQTHFTDSCEVTKEWFVELGKDKKEILSRI